MRQFEQLRATWTADTLEPITGFNPTGDRVVVRIVWHGGGMTMSRRWSSRLPTPFERSRIYFIEYFWDHAETLEAAGLRE
jgi:hypothetical protein